MGKEKIKKILTASIVLVLFSVNVNAQDANTGAVTLNVRLHHIQTLIINPDQKVVDLDYDTKDDYANGVQVTKNDHLQVYSTVGFGLKVKASGSEPTGTANTIAANTIGITASPGSQAS